MKKRLTLVASLVFVFCCLLALSISAAQCTTHTDNWTFKEGKNGYLGEIEASNVCSVCGTVTAKETIEPLFQTQGYAYSDFGAGYGGIVQHFAVNRTAVERYEALSGKTVRFGAVAAIKEALGDSSAPIDNEGNPINDSVRATEMTEAPYDIFDVMVNNIPSEYMDNTAIVCCAYVIIDGVVSYIENGAACGEPQANTFNQVVDKVENPVLPEEEKKSLKILTIGNSFSDDAMEYVYHIAKQAGYESVELGNLRRDSCSLEMHINAIKNDDKSGYIFRHWVDGASAWDHVWNVNNAQCAASPKDVLEMGIEWDYVVIQQVSSSLDYSAAQELLNLIKPYCPDATFAWHMTWESYTGTKTYEEIVAATEKYILPMEDIDIIIPTGTAIQNVWNTGLANNIVFRNKHLSYGLGRYVASLTLFKALTGRSIDNVVAPTRDTEGNSATTGFASAKPSFAALSTANDACIAAANNAVANPPVQVATARGKDE